MNKKGFTLIELLVVVLIIGILAAMALPSYQTAVDKARFVQALADLDAFKKAEELFYLANGRYTQDPSELDLDLGYTVFDNVSMRSRSKDGRCVIEMKEVDMVHGNATNTMAGNMFVWCYLKKPYAGNGWGERIGAFVYMDRATWGTSDNPQPIPANQRRLCVTFEGKNQTDRAERVCKSYGTEKITAVTSISAYPMP